MRNFFSTHLNDRTLLLNTINQYYYTPRSHVQQSLCNINEDIIGLAIKQFCWRGMWIIKYTKMCQLHSGDDAP